MVRTRLWLAASLLCLGVAEAAGAQGVTVTARVEIAAKDGSRSEKPSVGTPNLSEVVVWLNRLDRARDARTAQTDKKIQLVQKNKAFQPHLLVVPVGSLVDFPNRDPFFHNVFSLFDGKRFDLGLYEAGATNSVRFDRLGVSFLFCNIHPEMSAVVVAVDTPYYAISDRAGTISIPDVPEGKYQMHVWYERSLPEDLKGLSRTVTISAAGRDLGAIAVPTNPSFTPAHKNKYGQDYAPPPEHGYSHP